MNLLMPPKIKAKQTKPIELIRITGLSLENCYLTAEMLEILAKKLRINRTLVRLNLSCNGIKCVSGTQIISALKDNISVCFLDLSSNFLRDQFANSLADTLRVNNILSEIDISNNQVFAF